VRRAPSISNQCAYGSAPLGEPTAPPRRQWRACRAICPSHHQNSARPAPGLELSSPQVPNRRRKSSASDFCRERSPATDRRRRTKLNAARLRRQVVTAGPLPPRLPCHLQRQKPLPNVNLFTPNGELVADFAERPRRFIRVRASAVPRHHARTTASFKPTRGFLAIRGPVATPPMQPNPAPGPSTSREWRSAPALVSRGGASANRTRRR